MESIKIQELSFTYPGHDFPSIKDVSLEINQGEYIVIAGKSGCGKTTLLKHLKTCLTPSGKMTGTIAVNGKPLTEISLREQTELIGFVSQDPDNQIVTDKVWHELAFGLENLGFDRDTIRLRTAEMADWFGIGNWFDRNVNTLSGGQKQLLNLASVMALHPKILVLDEPVSQLDPVAASDFLETVNRINKELGTTVVITEHRLEEIFQHADRLAVMDDGKVISFDTPSEIGKNLSSKLSFIRCAMPSPMRIYAETGNFSMNCPVTVRDGRRWLQSLIPNVKTAEIKRPVIPKNKAALKVKNLYFKYDKNEKNVIEDLSCEFEKEKITAVLGGNGAGKSTLLKLLSGVYKPFSGKVKNDEKLKISCLPQQVKAVFTEKTIREDLKLIADEIDNAVSIMEIESVLDSHPFDVSGGELQRCAIAKVLLTKPDVLLLDEPTKGMDAQYKIRFAEILRDFVNSGKTVIIISHDIEFCAAYSDVCMMLFDGEIAAVKNAGDFFSGNTFYTTASHRMSSGIFSNAVTDREVVYLCKENLK